VNRTLSKKGKVEETIKHRPMHRGSKETFRFGGGSWTAGRLAGERRRAPHDVK
jgi:hypothetical protein